MKRASSESLDAYLRQFKLLGDELAAIGKDLPDDRNVFWALSGLSDDYQMFKTMMLRPPLPTFADMIVLLQSCETRVLQNSNASTKTTELVFVVQKDRGSFIPNKKPVFSSEKLGFAPNTKSETVFKD